LEARIVLEYGDKRVAKAVAAAVSPDNFKTPEGLSVETCCEEGKVATTIKCKRGITSLIATVDDLLFCVSTAEKTLHIARKLEKSLK
jgi:hypothetical protein